MKQIFINLPVQDVEKSARFYNALGFANYPLFSNKTQKCVAWSQHILIMLQSEEFFVSCNNKAVADTKSDISASFTLPVDSIESVNELVAIAQLMGGQEVGPIISQKYMTVRTIEDLDGHNWGIMYLDIEAFKQVKSNKQ